MRKLSEKIILVAGAAGNVGEGIVRAFLKENATVIAPSRNKEKLISLKDYCSDIDTGKLVTLRGNLGDAQAALELRNNVAEYFKEIDVVVASLGGWWSGDKMINIDMSDWNRVMIDNLMSHVHTIKNFVPMIKKKNGYYFHLNGYGAETIIPNSAPVTMAAAAQKMMALTLAEEMKDAIRVYEFILGIMKTRHRVATAKVNDNWYSPEEIGEYIADIIIGSNPDKNNTLHKLLSK